MLSFLVLARVSFTRRALTDVYYMKNHIFLSLMNNADYYICPSVISSNYFHFIKASKDKQVNISKPGLGPYGIMICSLRVIHIPHRRLC